MGVLAAPARAMVWMCPECRHGSSEARDERAHLDAHRQLQKFLREWDDAVVSDARAVTSGTRWCSPRVWLAALLIACVAGLLLARISGGAEPPPRTGAAGVLIPGVDLPRYDAPAVAPDPTAPVAGRAPVQAPSSPAIGRADAAAPSQTARPPSFAPPVEGAPESVAPATLPAVTDPRADTAAQAVPVTPGPTTAPPAHLVDACVVGLLCITVL